MNGGTDPRGTEPVLEGMYTAAAGMASGGDIQNALDIESHHAKKK